MIFKNFMLYQLTQPAENYFPFLKEKMPARAFMPCAPAQAKSIGFIPPADTELTHEQAGIMMLAVQIQEKKIPASALRDLVDEKAAVIEKEQERKVYRKERLAIKDEIVADKLPSVIPVNKRVYAYIDTHLNMIIVDTGSPGTAEIVLSLIRETIGSFPAIIPEVNNSASACMTGWIAHKLTPGEFKLGYDCELVEPGQEGGKVRCRGIDLSSEEVSSHIEAGKQISMLRVFWNEDLALSISSQHRIKSVVFSNKLLLDGQEGAEDDLSIFDADLAIMSGTLREFVPALGMAFGGWLEQKHMRV